MTEKPLRTRLRGKLGEKSVKDKPGEAYTEVFMTKTATSKAKAAKTYPALKPRQKMVQRNSAMAKDHAGGASAMQLAKKYRLSSARAYEILRREKIKSGKGAVVTTSPVGRAQTLLVQVAVLKEAVRNALNSPRANFTPKLGDEILGALASARTAEIAVKEASERLEKVKRRLQGKVASGKVNSVSVGWKAVARAARLGASSSKSAKV